MTLKVNLKHFQGKIHKSATVFSNDPQNPRVTLSVKGRIKALISLSPGNSIFFRGLANQIEEKSIGMSSTSKPFHITKLESDLDKHIAYRLETVEEGKHYRLEVKNRTEEGNYRGFIKVYTDMPQKPEIMIRVAGNIEGEIVVRPQTILIGKLAAEQPVRSGKVLVIDNLNKPFKITKMTYDRDLIEVKEQPLPEGSKFGYSIEIKPKNVDSLQGQNLRQQLSLVIATDAEPKETHEVKIYLVKQ